MDIKTLEDLKFWCLENNIPLEKARFALGEDKNEKCWFGIYQNSNGEWVVYKNKDDGTRFIKYQGESEEEAVKILLDKIKSEIRIRKDNKSIKKNKNNPFKKVILFLLIFIIVFAIYNLIFKIKSPNNGYYTYKNNTYYHQNNDWYIYDTYYDYWYPYYFDDSDIFLEDYEDYYQGYDYNVNDFETSFEDSDYYVEPNYANDDDYDFSWHSNSSWDSFDTDWGSDW